MEGGGWEEERKKNSQVFLSFVDNLSFVESLVGRKFDPLFHEPTLEVKFCVYKNF